MQTGEPLLIRPLFCLPDIVLYTRGTRKNSGVRHTPHRNHTRIGSRAGVPVKSG